MKSALVGFFPNLDPARVGGVEQSGHLAWTALCDALHARGERAQLFTYAPPRDAQRGGGARAKAQMIWRVWRAHVRPRVILVWHLGMLKLTPFMRAPHARRVIFLHGIEAWREQDPLTRRLLARTQLVLSNSAHTYTRFLESAPYARHIPHTVVPLGLGAPRGEIAAPSASSILMLARLERREDYKGHREMIGAWGKVRAQMPDAELWIAGDGDLRADLESLARATNVHPGVKFFGRVTESQKQELLNQCRAFAMPSRGEGFGLVYLEALRAGRPCLVSTVDAGREVVNPPEAGLAVNPNDADALADALARLLTPGNEWNAWSRAAQKRYAEHFTAAQFQERFCTALSKVW